MSFFVAKNIIKNYANHRALDDVSIEIPEGAIYGLLGPNGAGKTSLIRIINQITGPDSGELYFKDHKLEPADMNRIGYLPEERGLYKKMKVGEQAVYLARLKGVSRHEEKNAFHAHHEPAYTVSHHHDHMVAHRHGSRVAIADQHAQAQEGDLHQSLRSAQRVDAG